MYSKTCLSMIPVVTPLINELMNLDMSKPFDIVEFPMKLQRSAELVVEFNQNVYSVHPNPDIMYAIEFTVLYNGDSIIRCCVQNDPVEFKKGSKYTIGMSSLAYSPSAEADNLCLSEYNDGQWEKFTMSSDVTEAEYFQKSILHEISHEPDQLRKLTQAQFSPKLTYMVMSCTTHFSTSGLMGVLTRLFESNKGKMVSLIKENQ